jgi:hypothetical protein
VPSVSLVLAGLGHAEAADTTTLEGSISWDSRIICTPVSVSHWREDEFKKRKSLIPSYQAAFDRVVQPRR